MALVNGNDYDHIDLQAAAGGDVTRHMLKDAKAREDVSALKSAIVSEPCEISWVKGGDGGILYSNGELTTSTAFSYTDYINVSDFYQITYKRAKSTTTVLTGMAWYSEQNEAGYISGIQTIGNASDGYPIDYTVTVPTNAKYARFTYRKDTETYGNFTITGAKKTHIETKENRTEIKNIIGSVSKTSIPISWEKGSEGFAIKYADGTLGKSGAFSYTDYISVEMYDVITYKRAKSTAVTVLNGMAWYADKNEESYISGIQTIPKASDNYPYDYSVLVPNDAKYARFSYRTDTETYGEFTVIGRCKLSYKSYDLSKETELVAEKSTLVDGYSENATTMPNVNRSPWLFNFKRNDGYITGIKIRGLETGTLSIGVYSKTAIDGATYDANEYTLVETLNIGSLGLNEIQFTNPIKMETGKALAIGQPTDTGRFWYGGSGERGFFYLNDGTITYLDNTSLGITIYRIIPNIISLVGGKKISIYGDSISTYSGWIPDGNATYYTGTNAGVKSVNDTWWKKTIDATGMSLVVNNSWSGRAVSSCRDDESAHSTDAGYKEANVLQLKDGTTLPDIIIVKLGINDFNHGAYLGNYDGSTELPTDPTSFTNAYAMMLNLIMTNFPLATVYCCTLMQCEMNDSVIGFPEINTQGESLIQWNEAIRKLAHAFGAEVLDHDVCGITYYNLSTYMGDYSSSTHKGLHPNASGHSLIANKTIRQLDPAIRQRF